eukprot:scaffold181194_cov19-Prasinocladus_malaysianus.AAC.1
MRLCGMRDRQALEEGTNCDVEQFSLIPSWARNPEVATDKNAECCGSSDAQDHRSGACHASQTRIHDLVPSETAVANAFSTAASSRRYSYEYSGRPACILHKHSGLITEHSAGAIVGRCRSLESRNSKLP